MNAKGRSAASAASVGIVIIIVTLMFSSCTDILSAIFDTPTPGGVSASDGDYADRIHVSWSAPNLSGEKWKDYKVDHYEISWSGPTSGGTSTNGTSYDLYIDPLYRARTYDISVTVWLKPMFGSASSYGSSSDKGFAIDAPDLLWGDGGSDYYFSEADHWYVTMLQQGFSYSFAFKNGQTGSVEFYDYKTLAPTRAVTALGPTVSWLCNEGGAGHKFYIHVVPASMGASFRATYGF